MSDISKRLFDIIGAVVGLVILSPILAVLATWIKLDSEGPVFYRGIRVGRGERPFPIYKFRTMVVDAEQVGGPDTAEDDPRITGSGTFLRKYKLDELPQLINVLTGEMSFVGPRPEVQERIALYSEEEKAILSVRPGITDYASIEFSNEGEILAGSDDPAKAYLEKIKPEKVRLGLEYVNSRSLWVDLRILARTAIVIFKGGSKEGA